MSLIAWSSPPEPFIKVNVYGALDPVSGNLGAGGLARDSNGYWLWGFAKKVGTGSVLKAELYAILFYLVFSWQRVEGTVM